MNWPNKHERAITLEPGTINQAPSELVPGCADNIRRRTPSRRRPETQHNRRAGHAQWRAPDVTWPSTGQAVCAGALIASDQLDWQFKRATDDQAKNCASRKQQHSRPVSQPWCQLLQLREHWITASLRRKSNRESGRWRNCSNFLCTEFNLVCAS